MIVMENAAISTDRRLTDRNREVELDVVSRALPLLPNAVFPDWFDGKSYKLLGWIEASYDIRA